MPKHVFDTYRDDGKLIVFCRVCSKDNPIESEEYSGSENVSWLKPNKTIDKKPEQK